MRGEVRVKGAANVSRRACAGNAVPGTPPVATPSGVARGVGVVPGLMAANSLDFVHYPWSHSLPTTAVWAAAIGGAYGVWRRDRRAGWVVGALVASHWPLDLLMHRPDLPLWPGESPRVGLGMWGSIPLTIVLELLVFGAGLASYLRSTRARDAVGRWALWSFAALLPIVFLLSMTDTPPDDQRALGYGGLALWLFVPWCWWIDRHREPAAPLVSPAAPAPASGAGARP